MKRTLQTVAAAAGLFAADLAFATIDKTMKFSKPTNTRDATVRVTINPGQDVTVTIPPGTTAEGKRNLIRDALSNAGYDVVDNGAGGNQLTIRYLANGTKVKFAPGSTGEDRDDVLSIAAVAGTIEFVGPFDPFDQEFPELPAMFTAGIVTDVGELSARISAAELNFQTDGPIICQALFQRLAPRAPQYGAEINFAGDRLEVYFDPAYSITQGGIVFGTTSQSPGCAGELQSGNGGNPCPGDVNGDGVVDLIDLTRLLSAFGAHAGSAAYDPGADLDGDGEIGLIDLTLLLSAFGTTCG